MLKILFFTFLLIKINYAQNSTQMNQTIYQFSIEDINGDSFNFSNRKKFNNYTHAFTLGIALLL